MIEAGCTTVDDLRQWTPQGWEWGMPHPILPNAFIHEMSAVLKDPPPVPAMLRQGQCWKFGAKVAEITACSPDLVQVNAWTRVTAYAHRLSTSACPKIRPHSIQSTNSGTSLLGPTPVKVFLSRPHLNGTEQILGMHNSAPPGSHLPPDHVLQHLEMIRDLPWSGPPLIYIDGSFTPAGGPLANFCCPTETPPGGVGEASC